MKNKIELYSDNKNLLSPYIDSYIILKDISNIDKNKHCLIIINDPNSLNFLKNRENHIIITTFESNISDFEMEIDDLFLEKIDFFYTFIENFPDINNLPSKKYPKLEKIEPILIDSSIEIKNSNFKGISVKGIFIKHGHIRFFPIFNIWLSIYREKFSGLLLIERSGQNIFEATFNKGFLISLTTTLVDCSFINFLKNSGYISQKNIKNITVGSIDQIFEQLLSKNYIFVNEKNSIIYDYNLFLLKKLLTITTGNFTLSPKIETETISIFRDDLELIFKLYRYYNIEDKFENKVDKQQTFKVLKKIDINFDIVNKIFSYIDQGLTIEEIVFKFNKLEKKDIFKIVLISKTIDIIKFNNIKNKIFISNNITENISKRISVWYEKIKKENYFSILGVMFNDSGSIIEERYNILKKQFHLYLSSEVVREKYYKEINEIIFAIDSAYTVLIDDKTKNDYYKNMLEV